MGRGKDSEFEGAIFQKETGTFLVNPIHRYCFSLLIEVGKPDILIVVYCCALSFVFLSLSCLGPLPKFLDEWKHLLELLLSRDHHGSESRDNPHVCTPLAASDWLADLTWSNVMRLMLERLGAGHTVNLLQALPLDTPLLTTDFYYSCLLGAVIERRQRLIFS